jgi:hypothetical protein
LIISANRTQGESCLTHLCVWQHVDLKSRCSMAIHHSTFVLTDESVAEPPRRLREALERKGLPLDCFVAVPLGDTVLSKGLSGATVSSIGGDLSS